MNHDPGTTLLLALYQVEGVMKLIEGNEYEKYMHVPLSTVKYELKRQLSLLDRPLNDHYYRYIRSFTQRTMSSARLRDPSDPLYDPTDKWNEYKVDLHCNEEHSPDEWDPQTEGKIADPSTRHRDKVLDAYCDNHPGSPMCKVFDE